jgi:hypothetical protein
MYNHFISTKFEKHIFHDGTLQGRYAILRKEGCILSQLEFVDNDKLITIIDIEFMSYIYKIVLENDNVYHIYNMTKLTELITP